MWPPTRHSTQKCPIAIIYFWKLEQNLCKNYSRALEKKNVFTLKFNFFEFIFYKFLSFSNSEKMSYKWCSWKNDKIRPNRKFCFHYSCQKIVPYVLKLHEYLKKKVPYHVGSYCKIKSSFIHWTLQRNLIMNYLVTISIQFIVAKQEI